jgi:hypothetical protein
MVPQAKLVPSGFATQPRLVVPDVLPVFLMSNVLEWLELGLTVTGCGPVTRVVK